MGLLFACMRMHLDARRFLAMVISAVKSRIIFLTYRLCYLLQACCTEAGMFALRERRVHVTQEDFEMAVAKVMKKDSEKNMSLKKLWK